MNDKVAVSITIGTEIPAQGVIIRIAKRFVSPGNKGIVGKRFLKEHIVTNEGPVAWDVSHLTTCFT